MTFWKLLQAQLKLTRRLRELCVVRIVAMNVSDFSSDELDFFITSLGGDAAVRLFDAMDIQRHHRGCKEEFK